MLKFKEKSFYSLLDANLNRAREGLRVAEDLCRFVLNHQALAQQLKALRHEITSVSQHYPAKSLLDCRDSSLDVLARDRVRAKPKLTDIFLANTNRALEALRVLEEIAQPSQVYNRLRYQLYDCQKEIYPHILLRQLFAINNVYAVSDDVSVLKQAVRQGAKIIQLRDKISSQAVIVGKARALKQFLQPYEVLFIINDSPKICRLVGADGVHLGQDDLSTQTARRILGQKLIGRSTHSLAQAKKAIKTDVNYISVGPVFTTPTKPDYQALGLERVRKIIAEVDFPIVAIGGINQGNVRQVRQCGAKVVAAVRGSLALLSNGYNLIEGDNGHYRLQNDNSRLS